MNITERIVLRRAQRQGVVVPPTKAATAATLALVRKGHLVFTRDGFAITKAGRTVDTREPGAREWDHYLGRRT